MTGHQGNNGQKLSMDEHIPQRKLQGLLDNLVEVNSVDGRQLENLKIYENHFEDLNRNWQDVIIHGGPSIDDKLPWERKGLFKDIDIVSSC